MHRAVNVRLELYAVFAQRTELVQAKALKPAAVCEDRSIPRNESVKASKPVDRRVSGPKEKMIGVSEDDRCTGCFEHFLGQSLDCTLGSDRHEDRRIDGAVRG